jgi:uncharacterized protein YjbI with pentapeptide repeats
MSGNELMRHLFRCLYDGAEGWNSWRRENPDIELDFSGEKFEGALRGNLSEIDFSGAKFHRANLRSANLRGANFSNSELYYADLSTADLYGTNFSGASLYLAKLDHTDLVGACLTKADLTGVTFHGADLTNADFSDANLSGALFGDTLCVGTNFSRARLRSAGLRESNFSNANFSNCEIYGIAAWDIDLDGAIQTNLIIKSPYYNVPTITVDNLEVAQFIHLLINNQKIREVITSITSKTVLILGRFTPERKAVLDALREELRRHDYLPILFDFDVPEGRDTTEVVILLASMARFIIADLTEPNSIPKELETIVHNLAVPVQPLIEGSARPYSMFRDNWKYDWVLNPHRYEGLRELIASIGESVIAPAENKIKELEKKRRESFN